MIQHGHADYWILSNSKMPDVHASSCCTCVRVSSAFEMKTCTSGRSCCNLAVVSTSSLQPPESFCHRARRNYLLLSLASHCLPGSQTILFQEATWSDSMRGLQCCSSTSNRSKSTTHLQKARDQDTASVKPYTQQGSARVLAEPMVAHTLAHCCMA